VHASRLLLIGMIAICAMLAGGTCAALAAPYSDLLIDVNSGQVLHEASADAQRFPASLTKMMTLYITFDMLRKGRLELSTQLEISEYDTEAQPSKLGLQVGDHISVEDAIRALVTASANDAARAIAENLGGNEEKFARYMTWQAKALGMASTVYRNASGLPDPEQVSTARDYATLALHLYDDFPQYFNYFKTTYFAYGRARYRNHNGLLFNFQGTDGIKTGYTRLSGFNLVASVHRNGKHIIGVVFGGSSVGDRNIRMRNLITAGFEHASAIKTRIARPQLVAEAKRKSKAVTVLAASVSSAAVGESTAADATTVMERMQPKPSMAPRISATANSVGDPIAMLLANGSTNGKSSQNVIPAAMATIDTPHDDENSLSAQGPFHVQIGAFATQAEANQRLERIEGTAADLLMGHTPISVTYTTQSKTWYRARFAGFDRTAADATCEALKTRQIDCVVMRAN
jgi:D-alanyl-D-alanine carboxypeptidase